MEKAEIKKQSDHQIAIHGFDGEEAQIITADEIRFCVPTKKCVQFWATIIACFIAIAIGVVFMLISNDTQQLFAIGQALLCLGCGVLIPGNNSSFVRWRMFTVLVCPINSHQVRTLKVWQQSRRAHPSPLPKMATSPPGKNIHKMCGITGCLTSD